MTASTQNKHCLLTEALAQFIGNPHQADNPFSYARLAELDRLEDFPSEACRALNDFGLNKYYVPACYGGLLTSYEEMMQLWRIVARRDLTLVVAHGITFLGAASVWVAGLPEQAKQLGVEITQGSIVSWGLTERHHGSDLLAGELSATSVADGWCINGEKWLINNATRGQMICVLARTSLEGGARGFSLFLVDKRQFPSHTYHYLPKERTHGIRGADISGIVFQKAVVPSSRLVGRSGEGIETVLKALQLTRTLSVALSQGAADHALQLTVDFAEQHKLYDRRLIDLPLACRTIGEAATALLVAEAVCTVASRSIHALTAEMSVISAITKSFVPTIVDEMIFKLSELLGARAFLTEEYAQGMFQKLERDHRIVGIFDGSTIVNRNALINQFPTLARAYYSKRCEQNGLVEAVTFTHPLTEFSPKRLSLLSNTGCSVVQSLPNAIIQVWDLVRTGTVSASVGYLAEKFWIKAEAVIAEMSVYEPSARDVPATAFTLAMRYELCFAGAACLQLWLCNQTWASNKPVQSVWQDALWLEASLVFILNRLCFGEELTDAGVYERLTNKVIIKQRQTPLSLLLDSEAGSR